MSLFEKIGRLFSPKEALEKEAEAPQSADVPDACHSQAVPEEENEPQEEIVTEPVKEPIKKEELPLEDKERLLHFLIKSMNEFLDLETGDKTLVIWLDTDYLTFQTYDTEKYRKRIQTSLLNEYELKVASVTFRIGKPSEELRCKPLGRSGKAFLQLASDKVATTTHARKASISIFADRGSLLHGPYILSADEMNEKNIPAYNIGAGEFPQVQTGYRQNHIAIDDDPNSPMIEKNKFVSRTHAHIGFSEQFGFYLQVEISGTRRMGKRTRIFRGEQAIELDNPQAKEPLQNGDLIELGKAVMLQFVEIKN